MEEIVQEIPKAHIKIIGTSHIARQSAREIKHAFDELQPDIIAVELDKQRLQALLDPKKQDGRLPLSLARQIGVTGYLFAVIGKALQKKMGDFVGVNPGADMLQAVHLAKDKQLHLVDQEIMITLRHLSKSFTFKEKMRLLWDVVSGPFGKKMKIDISKLPSKKMIVELLKMLKDRYPNLYHVLIIERNIVMARKLDEIVRKNPGKKILLVIGAGHEEDLRVRLQAMQRIADIS